MHTNWTSVGVVSAVVLVSWLATNAVPRQIDGGAPRPLIADAREAGRDVALDDVAVAVAAQASRLEARLADAPTPRRTARNPFRLSTVPVSRSDRVAIGRTEAVGASAPPAVAPGPAEAAEGLALIGIAESVSEATGEVERRAIVSGRGQVFIVGRGDALDERLTVVEIGAEGVEFSDAVTAGTVRLGLR